MSGGHFNRKVWQLKELSNMIEGNRSEGEIKSDKVNWDISFLCEFLYDLYDLLYAYDYWVCGDHGEDSYREVEEKFLEKWEQFGL